MENGGALVSLEEGASALRKVLEGDETPGPFILPEGAAHAVGKNTSRGFARAGTERFS